MPAAEKSSFYNKERADMSMAKSKQRIKLTTHLEEIKQWVEEGKSDDWIASALGTTASSVQSFRSRRGIYRRSHQSEGIEHLDKQRAPVSIFEGVLEHGERDGWGMWFDPSVAEEPLWKNNWAGVGAVRVTISSSAIILEAEQPKAKNAPEKERTSAPSQDEQNRKEKQEHPGRASSQTPDGAPHREQGRLKWFDPKKGYGFVRTPEGEDLFVHHSEVNTDPNALEMGMEVSYEVGRNERGEVALKLKPLVEKQDQSS